MATGLELCKETGGEVMTEQWSETYKNVVITADGPVFSATIDGKPVRKPSVAAVRAAINKAQAAVFKPVEIVIYAYGKPRVQTAVNIDRQGILFEFPNRGLAHDRYGLFYDLATFPMAEAQALSERRDQLEEDERRLKAKLTRISADEIERRMREGS